MNPKEKLEHALGLVDYTVKVNMDDLAAAKEIFNLDLAIRMILKNHLCEDACRLCGKKRENE